MKCQMLAAATADAPARMPGGVVLVTPRRRCRRSPESWSPSDDRADQVEVVALAGAVAVDALQEDLAGAAFLGLACPGDGIQPGRSPAAVDEDLGSARRRARRTSMLTTIGLTAEAVRAPR